MWAGQRAFYFLGCIIGRHQPDKSRLRGLSRGEPSTTCKGCGKPVVRTPRGWMTNL
jgi:hypothetical protein